MSCAAPRTCSSGLLAGIFLFVGSGLALAQRTADPAGRAPREAALDPRARFLVSGRVLAEDGNPAKDAIVTSSAGGRTVTNERGDYRLELEVPLGVERLQIRATAAAEQSSASTDVSLSRAVGRARVLVDPLQLCGSCACEPSWIPTFGGEPGVSGTIDAFTVFDDGQGPALVAGGTFLSAGGTSVNNIARWDGSRWSALAGGVSHGVDALVVHDDGTGPALYAGGGFTMAGGAAANKVARWDGSSWSAVGNPFGAGVSAHALVVHDDGSGPALYAGGTYGHVSRWNGATWSELPDGPDNSILALVSFDDGSSPALYAGGHFLTVDGVPMPGVARWDGSAWSGLAGGRNSTVHTLVVHDDGSGPALYAGGSFSGRISRWNGSAWSSVGSGVNSTVHALTVHDDGGGPALYAGGVFTRAGGQNARRIARWNGTSWAALGSGANSEINALASFDDGSGARLFAGGIFWTIGGVPANRFGSWDGTSWAAYGDGPSSHVNALAVHDDGSGPALYARGGLNSAGGVVLNGIGRWDGACWSALGCGLDGLAEDLAVHDDGSGPALYVGGVFSNAGGSSANSIAKWDGTAWSRLGSGMGTPGNLQSVEALVSHDDGSGPALYAAGSFGAAGGVTARNIARWNGSSWEAVAGGLGGVLDLAVFDDGAGGGVALYVCGGFAFAHPVSGFPVLVNNIAKWDGSGWSALGEGLNGLPLAMAVHDDGSGPALYVGGTCTEAGGIPARRLARWNGSSWSAVGVVEGFVAALAVHDDGGGPALYVGGDFQSIGATSLNRIARWDGAVWTPLGSGLNGGPANVLASFDDGGGPALFAGGAFSAVPDAFDSYLAKWAGAEVGIDFATEDDFATALVNGQELSTPPEFGRLISLASSGPNAGAAIFDSTPGGPNDPSQDLDLLVGRGHILMLQTDANTTQTVPGIFDRPNDDSDGGSLVFDFHAPVAPVSVDLIDIDSGASESSAVILTDAWGRARTYAVPRGWTGDRSTDGTSGVGTLDLATLDPQPGFLAPATASETPGFAQDRVVQIEVRLGGSGAVDALRWCPRDASAGAHGPRPARSAAPGGSITR